jgi:very-short-patch-repair endonuclease
MQYYCSECKATITENVYNFSKNKYGKALCMTHQRTLGPPPPPPATKFQSNRQYYCYICKESISPQVCDYSTKNLGTALCMKHQKTVTPEALKLSRALRSLEVEHILEAYDGHKHVDIAIESAKLYIELDGSQHGFSSKQMLADDDRDKHSVKAGYTTKRIPNSWVNQNTDKLALNIARLAMKRQSEIKEQENRLTLTGTVTGIMKTVIKTARKLSEKLDDFE